MPKPPSECQCRIRHLLELRGFWLLQIPLLASIALLFGWSMTIENKAICAEFQSRPNVVLIMADDFGYECVAANGGGYATPHLDQLARNGVRFDRCYVQPLCTPTRVQLMTGQYNVRNYVKFGYLDPKQKTFAHWFRAAGYATCVVGKWQLQGGLEGPRHFGFDDYCLWQLTRRPARYVNPGLEVNGREMDYSNGEYGPDLVNDHLLSFIEQHRDTPFFAYYPLMLTHSPYEPTPDSPDYDRTVKGPEASRKNADRKHFADNVKYQDKLIGKLVAKLEQLGLRERTLLVFLGDNGTGKGVTSKLGDGTIDGGKGSTTESGMHVPLIVNWPKKIVGGRVSHDLVDSTDFVPTLLDAARIVRPQDWKLDGHSLWPMLLGQPDEPRRAIYSWYAPQWGDKPVEFARGERLKLYRDGRVFDVVADPGEKSPRQGKLTDAEQAVVVELQQTLARFDDARPAWTTEPVPAKTSEAPKKRAKKKSVR
jgi:arylsulfatase A